MLDKIRNLLWSHQWAYILSWLQNIVGIVWTHVTWAWSLLCHYSCSTVICWEKESQVLRSVSGCSFHFHLHESSLVSTWFHCTRTTATLTMVVVLKFRLWAFMTKPNEYKQEQRGSLAIAQAYSDIWSCHTVLPWINNVVPQLAPVTAQQQGLFSCLHRGANPLFWAFILRTLVFDDSANVVKFMHRNTGHKPIRECRLVFIDIGRATHSVFSYSYYCGLCWRALQG